MQSFATCLTEGISQLGDAQLEAVAAITKAAQIPQQPQPVNPPIHQVITHTAANFNIELPRFNGSGDYLTFEKRLITVFKAKNCLTTPDGLAWALTALDGLASQYADSLYPQNLEELLAGLKQRFVPANDGFRLRNHLSQLRQHGDNFDKFLRDFNFTLSRIDDMSDADAKWAFTRGLPISSQNEIHYRNPETLADAQDIAHKIHYAYRQDATVRFSQDDPMQINTHSHSNALTKYRNPRSHSPQGSSFPTYTRPGRSSFQSPSRQGYRRSQSPSNSSRSSFNRNSRFQSPHQRTGQRWSGTGSVSHNSFSGYKPQGNSQSSYGPRPVCLFCGKPGHFMKDCSQFKNSSSHQTASFSPKPKPKSTFPSRLSGNGRGSR